MAKKLGHLWETTPPAFTEKTTVERIAKYSSPIALWEACVKYFEWVESSPLHEEVLHHYQGEIIRSKLKKRRTMTMAGLWTFLGVSDGAWCYWRNSPNPELSTVVQHVDRIIYEQKFSGAAAGLFNANFIARDLGLADTHDLRSGDGSMSPDKKFDASLLSDTAIDEILKARDDVIAERDLLS